MKILLSVLIIFLTFNFAHANDFVIPTHMYPEIFNKKGYVEDVSEKLPTKEDIMFADWNPYMKELSSKIKKVWVKKDIEKNDTNKVVVIFTILKDGTLKEVNLRESSGVQKNDDLAIESVKESAPFSPLPVGFSGDSVEIEFTFECRVIGVSYK